MIIPLVDAKLIDENITQEDLDAFESSVRRLTNNNFQNRYVRFEDISYIDGDRIKVNEKIEGLRVNDTVEINYSKYNDGLYTVEEIKDKEIKLKGRLLHEFDFAGVMLTKVEYPPDIVSGIKKLINYDKKMAGKTGIKSESISRMSITYYDVNGTDNTEGYPSSLLSFLKKYQKMRW